jgi:hypothetical protein
MKTIIRKMATGLALGSLALLTTTPALRGSSHMDAPLITLDDPANTTDVYSFVSTVNGTKYLVTSLAVYPFEEPGVGPNVYRFDDNVLYSIHVATGKDVAAGRATFTYNFRFNTSFKNKNTILQAFTGVVNAVNDPNQNLVQTYSVTRTETKKNKGTLLGNGVVPPNNQGLVTPKYNQGNNGENPAKEGVSDPAQLDDYTMASIYNLGGHLVFAGQRDDGFYADIQSIFDLDFSFSGPNKPFDSQGGFNVHTIVLAIPVAQLGGDQQIAGVYATTSRQKVTVLKEKREANDNGKTNGPFVQVARQGNPLFNEALVAIKDKDLYNRTDPTSDAELFRQYALNPELAAVLGVDPNRRTNRTDIAAIFIPDLIKTDLSTQPARLAGPPDEPGFHRLSIFGGDVLTSTVQPGFGNGTVPGGWPNGRRFGDDVVDIAVIALFSDLRTSPPQISDPTGGNVDKVTSNDISYNRTFPYAATPLNGRNHPHHGDPNTPAP